MKKTILLPFLLFAPMAFSQANCDKFAAENLALKNENQILRTDNDYFKRILEIQKSISEIKTDETIFKITNITGDKMGKSVIFTILVETKDKNKDEYSLEDISIIDLEGNEINTDFGKSEGWNGILTLDTPKKIKLGFAYKSIENDFPKIIKLLRMTYKYRYEAFSGDKNRKILEFKNLNVNWK